jgi:polysaccharide deacetylase 2 family uncharacterized protein YibQ
MMKSQSDFIQYMVFFLDINPNNLYEKRNRLFFQRPFQNREKRDPMPENRVYLSRRRFFKTLSGVIAGSALGLNRLGAEAFGFGEKLAETRPAPRIALIIDDIGHSLSRARQFLDLDIPVTFSILPRLAHSRALADEIHAGGREIMLHQPMEPYNADLNPGPGALYIRDGSEKIIHIMEENIGEVPHALGVNNHMGSRFTASEQKMRVILPVIKGEGLYFVDSVTSSRSKAFQAACKLHVTAASRNIFLDNHLEEASIIRQLKRLSRHACRHGHAIGIGHPHPETARAIDKFLRYDMPPDLSLVPVSRILRL